MRPGAIHRRNSAFVRSSALGEAKTPVVINEVTLQRGRGAKRVIVKDDVISQQNFKFPKWSQVTFEANLTGSSGYFYATFTHLGVEHLLFAAPVARKISRQVNLEVPLNNLNFHIAPKVPSDLNPAYIDPVTRDLLTHAPSAYTSLGFIPTEPEVRIGPSSPEALDSRIAMAKAMMRFIPAYGRIFDALVDQKTKLEAGEISEWEMWNGDVASHSWKYGKTGSDVTKGSSVRYWQNFDAGWLAHSSIYRFFPERGWEPLQGNILYTQVGQPHCIVTRMYGYKDTAGRGGEYHPYKGNGRSNTNTTWGAADYFSYDNIRLMEFNARNNHDRRDHDEYGENIYKIQDKGSHIDLNFDGGPHYPAGKDMDKFCAKVEWWNPDTNEWSEPMIHPPSSKWSAKISSGGKFAFYFRFPRQLTQKDEFYDLTPQWQIEKTWDSYPRGGNTSEDPVRYTRIGRPPTRDTSNRPKEEQEGLKITLENGEVLSTSSETPPYSVMICPESRSDGPGWDEFGPTKQKSSYICTTGSVAIYATDPYAYSYSDNPDIMKAYWVGGNFKPGGSFMVLGKALDFFDGFWVSTQSLDTYGATPMDLRSQQYEFKRGDHEPNSYDADFLRINGITDTFKLVNIEDPAKASKFQDKWEACFPGVPFTKEIITAVLRGDQLPELEGIKNETLPGLLEDDPLRYEVDYEGVKYRHSYSMAFVTIPEGWWGPTVTLDGDSINTVYIGGQNQYYYIKEEKVDLKDEIEEQVAKEEAGATAAEAFADSNLENPMVDVTYEAYKNRNDLVADSINNPPDENKEKSWFFRTENVTLKHRKFSLLGSVGTVTDVTDKYSADHVTSLDGLSPKNTAQYHFNELFVVEGIGNSPSIVMTPPKEPEGGVPVKHSNVSGFGNIERQALKSRALGHGNPMKYSTENELDSLKPTTMGNIQASSLDGMIDDVLGDYMDPIKQTLQILVFTAGAALVAGAVIKARPLLLKGSTAKEQLKEQRFRTALAEKEFNDSVEESRRKSRKKK